MKLKKIASLALAGVMAVSMLTACGGNTISDDEQNNKPEEPAVTGYSAKLEAAMSKNAQDNIDLTDDADLNAALEKAVGNIGYNVITDGFIGQMTDGTVQYYDCNSTAPAIKVVVNSLRNDLGVPFKWRGDMDKEIRNLEPTRDNNDPQYYRKDDVNTVLLFAVDGGVVVDNAVEQVASKIQKNIEALVDDFDADSDGKKDSNFHYTGSVATCTKTYEAGHGMSVTFIAVELVRHVGK